MLYLFDTTAFSDLMHEHPQTCRRMEEIAADDTAVICPVVRGEIIYGIDRLVDGRRKRGLQARADWLFSKMVCQPIPASAGDHYARVKLSRQKMGLPMDENDLWIAATALALGARLVSRDSDYRSTEGLEVEDWSTLTP